MAELVPLEIKRNDRRPYFRFQLLNGGVPVPGLTGAELIQFLMRLKGSAVPKVNAAAIWLNASQAIGEYRWAAVDTQDAGEYEAEIELRWPNGDKETWPNNHYYPVTIYEDVGNRP